MELQSRIDRGHLVVSVVGRLDTGTAPEFDQVCQALMQEGNNRIILDLSTLEYISSAGLRSVISTAKRAKNGGGGLYLSGATGLVQEVLAVSGFDRLLPTFGSVDIALESLV
jgi:anti-anti-sigma factor